MAPHTPGVLRFGKLSKKPVAPAGYKNKQCRKQTSVLSGRIVTAYVPLRSATERERAAFLIPCQGLRGFDSISLLTFHLSSASLYPPCMAKSPVFVFFLEKIAFLIQTELPAELSINYAWQHVPDRGKKPHSEQCPLP